MEMRIRVATPADIDAVLVLWQQAGAEPSHTDDASGVGALLAHDPEALLLADTQDGVVGSIIAGWDGWRGSIYRLAVHPSFGRRGIASRLLAEAERRLLARGCRRFQATVVGSSAEAMGFWRAAGWQQQEDRLRFVRDDGGRDH